MAGYVVVNLKRIIDNVGEERAKQILSNFKCTLNNDVDVFLHQKSIEFAKQGLSQTHLVLTSYKGTQEIVGYFTLANKYITIRSDSLSKTTRRRINKFATFDRLINSYCLSAPLIAQLSKNFNRGLNDLITGDELLKIACDKVKNIQLDLGGKFVYLECEDIPSLINFYSSNGFMQFDKRVLDKDESNLKGDYLVQMLKYIH